MKDQERPDRPEEMPAVKTTIVGGRPPGCGKTVGNIPRGIEILIKKASVDPDFRALLLDQRSKAAETIDLTLEPAESKMLNAIPKAQLETIVSATRVPQEMGRKLRLLGKAAGLTLAALGAAAGDCDSGKRNDLSTALGSRPDMEPPPARVTDTSSEEEADKAPTSQPNAEREARPAGILPDRPAVGFQTRGISPDRPETRPADQKGETDLSEGQRKD